MLRVVGVKANTSAMTLELGSKKAHLFGSEHQLAAVAESLRVAGRDLDAEAAEDVIREAMLHAVGLGILLVQTQAPVMWREHA